MHNTDSFILLQFNNIIKICHHCKNFSWSIFKIIEGNSSISSIFLNKTDNLMITGSLDKTIKFWDEKFQWNCTKLIQADDSVFNCILNANEDKLFYVSGPSGSKTKICILELNINGTWQVIQKVLVDSGLGPYFITNNMIAIFPNQFNQIHLFQWNNEQRQFDQQAHPIAMCEYHPVQFFQSNNVLALRKQKDNKIIIAKITENCECEILYWIANKSETVKVISEDSKYFIYGKI